MSRTAAEMPPWEEAIRRAVGGTEAIAGLCLTGFLVVVVLGVGGGSVLLTAWTGHRTIVPANQLPLWTLVWALVTAAGVKAIAFLVKAVERAAMPIPLSIADGRLRVRPWLRPFVAAGWVSLAVGALLVAHYVVDYLRSLVVDPTDWRYRVLVPIVVLFAGAVATNTNLLVATAAATGRAGAVRTVYRLRLLLDVIATIVMLRIQLPHVDPFTGRHQW